MRTLGYSTPEGFDSPQFVTSAKVQAQRRASLMLSNQDMQIEWAVQLLQTLQLVFVKLSFVVLFRRLFTSGASGDKFSAAATAMIVIITVWGIAFFLTFLFACKGDIAAWWSGASLQKCIGLKLEISFGLSDCLIDILIIAMPLPMVRYTFRSNLLSRYWSRTNVSCANDIGMESSHDHGS